MATADITSFSGVHRWLSNFWPCLVIYEGWIYPSVEHAYQAAKCHPSQRAPFQRPLVTAGDAKRLGRKGKMRTDWDQVKQSVMAQCLREKFGAGSELAAKLIATGDVQIVEGNTWGDVYWGVCRGVGENHLGRLIMQRRAELRL